MPWAYYALVLFAVTGLIANALGFVIPLSLLGEAGYPDAYFLHDAREYAQTGRMYRGPGEAPYNPSSYSPLFYFVLSLPFRVSEASNPFLGPRLIVGAFVAACVLVIMSTTRALARHPSVVRWSGLLGSSILIVGSWSSQLRPDFMGVFFGLLAARLLLARWRLAAALAGLAAGTAFAFKLTLVSAALSGLAWLLWTRRYRHLFEFLAGAAVTGLGGYLVFLPFEPHMHAHLFALKDFPPHYLGVVRLVYAMVKEPVTLLALSVLPLILRRPGPRRTLLLLYGAITLLISSIAAINPGANTNYFLEFLMVAVPIASMAPPRLYRMQNRAPVPQILLAAMIVAFFVQPAVSFERLRPLMDVTARNAEWVGLESLLKEERVLSLVPEIAFHTRTPPVTEPFVLRVFELRGRFDLGPLADRIRAREYDLVVTNLVPRSGDRALEPDAPGRDP